MFFRVGIAEMPTKLPLYLGNAIQVFGKTSIIFRKFIILRKDIKGNYGQDMLFNITAELLQQQQFSLHRMLYSSSSSETLTLLENGILNVTNLFGI